MDLHKLFNLYKCHYANKKTELILSIYLELK